MKKKEPLIQLRHKSLNFKAMSFISVVNHDMAHKFLQSNLHGTANVVHILGSVSKITCFRV